MKLRKLRIAWSIFWGLACLLLIGLWVRSYWWLDISHLIRPQLMSARGKLSLVNEIKMTVSLSLADVNMPPAQMHRNPYIRGFSYTLDQVEVDSASYIVVIPIWIPTLVVALFTAVPWLPSRFSLRTLLITTTLVAVVLGLVVWAARK